MTGSGCAVMCNLINTTTTTVVVAAAATTTTTTDIAAAATTTTSVLTSPWGCLNWQLLLMELYLEDTTRLAPASYSR